MKPSLEMLLRSENQQLRDSQAVMAGFLVGLLQEKHSGRAFVSMTTLAEVQSKPYQIKGVAQPELGNLCLTVIGPDGKEQVMDDAKPPEVAYAKSVMGVIAASGKDEKILPPALSDETPTEEVSALVECPPNSPPCSGPWHSSSDRLGFACPNCGSSEVSPMREDDGIEVDINKES